MSSRGRSLPDEDDDNKAEMVKMVRIGMVVYCEANVASRWVLKNAVDMMEELKVKENANKEYSFYSSVNDERTSFPNDATTMDYKIVENRSVFAVYHKTGSARF
jgi:hypothetical protein